MSSQPMSTVPLSSWGDSPEVEQPANALFQIAVEMDVGIVSPAIGMLSRGSAGFVYAVRLRPRPLSVGASS